MLILEWIMCRLIEVCVLGLHEFPRAVIVGAPKQVA